MKSEDPRIRHEVELPSGRRVQVTYLDGDQRWPVGGGAGGSRQTPVRTAAALQRPPEREPIPPAATAAGANRAAGLHVCQHCGGGLVHPLDWEEAAPERWRILMRCPDCGHRREGVFGRTLVERLDDELDRASGALLSDLRRLTHANMSEEIDRFARALQLDLIGPDDFR